MLEAGSEPLSVVVIETLDDCESISRPVKVVVIDETTRTSASLVSIDSGVTVIVGFAFEPPKPVEKAEPRVSVPVIETPELVEFVHAVAVAVTVVMVNPHHFQHFQLLALLSNSISLRLA